MLQVMYTVCNTNINIKYDLIITKTFFIYNWIPILFVTIHSRKIIAIQYYNI